MVVATVVFYGCFTVVLRLFCEEINYNAVPLGIWFRAAAASATRIAARLLSTASFFSFFFSPPTDRFSPNSLNPPTAAASHPPTFPDSAQVFHSLFLSLFGHSLAPPPIPPPVKRHRLMPVCQCHVWLQQFFAATFSGSGCRVPPSKSGKTTSCITAPRSFNYNRAGNLGVGRINCTSLLGVVGCHLFLLTKNAPPNTPPNTPHPRPPDPDFYP